MAALALLAPAAPVHAQQSPTCGWHFLDGTEAPPTLERLLARQAELTERHSDAVQRFRQWITACDHTASREASMSLRNERRRTNSTDPFLRALLGITLVRGPDVHVLNAEGALLRPVNRHTNAEIEGVRLLTAVVEDTGWPEIITELAAVAVATGKSESLKVSAESLRNVPDSLHTDDHWMALGEVELARGNYEEAAGAVNGLAAEHPRAARVLGIARMMADDDPVVGGDIYLSGLAAADDTPALHRYFDDIRLILSSDEMAAWNALDDGHAAWIRGKWEWRSMLAGIRVAERLAEHHRRLEFVLRNYRRTSYRGAPVPTTLWVDTTMPVQEMLDDRGMIHLRHGEPENELRMAPAGRPGVRNNVQRLAWTYTRPGAIQPVYEFDRGSDRADYFLAEPYPICEGTNVATGRAITDRTRSYAEFPVAGDVLDWGMRLHAFDPSLGMYYRRCETSPGMAQLSYQHLLGEARVQGRRMLNSENAVPRLKHPLTTTMNLYAFRGRDATELVAYLAVHAGELTPRPASMPHAYAFRILFGAGDPATEAIAQADTVIAFTRPEPLPADAVVGTAVPLRVRSASDARVTLSVLNGYDSGQGQVMATTRDIRAFGDALALSDIVIAEPRDGAWRRGTARLAPAQGHAIAEESPFRLYYELYNAQAGDQLEVSIIVAPGRDEGLLARLRDLISQRNALSLVFSEEAAPEADGVLRIDREVTAALEPGSYVVLITVRNERTGESAEAETGLVIVER
jgi:hypothetical protein